MLAGNEHEKFIFYHIKSLFL